MAYAKHMPSMEIMTSISWNQYCYAFTWIYMDLIRARDSHPIIGSKRQNLASQRTASSIYYLTFFYRVFLALFLQETYVA